MLLATGGVAQELKKMKIAELNSYIESSTKPMIIGFWATWCAPCVEEIPHLQNAARRSEGKVELILVSLDSEKSYPDKIKTFMNKNSIKSPVVWLDETNADYFCPFIDSSWSGSIPATLFVNNKSKYRFFIEEQLSEDEIDKRLQEALQ